MMTAFQIGILIVAAISGMMCLAGKPEERKDGTIVLAVSGILFLLSEALKIFM